MLSFEDVQLIVNSVECSLFGQAFVFRFDKHEGTERWFIQARINRPDIVTGEWGQGGGGKLYVSPHATEDEIVKKCLGACLAFVEHEVREGFAYELTHLFSPHIGVRHLMSIAD